jgi:Uma2 family endonuclease
MGRATLEHPKLDRAASEMTYAQFLATDFPNHHVEWVNGRAINMPPIPDGHQDIGGFLLSVLRSFAEERNLGLVRHDPFQMKTGPDLPGRAPDIFFLSNANKRRLKRTYLQGPADLVVEIISPDYRGVDRGEKFYEYEKGGVPEYWLIDPERKQAECYLRDKKGIYKLTALDQKGIYHSVMMPGLWIDPEWFWKPPLPTVLTIQKLWGLV